MREQFEKLPEIARMIYTYDVLFANGMYECGNLEIRGYVNGAWYAFQEQQKSIDDLNLKIQDLIIKYDGKTTLPILDQWSDCFVKSAKGIVNDLKELLK